MSSLRFQLAAAIFILFAALTAKSQDLPKDELQIALNTYFDSYDVQIVYPTISLTKKYREGSTFNVRYLVDVITAASMRSHFEIDGVTSATEKDDGGGDNTPDELRQEAGFGITEVMTGGLLKNSTISLNGLYSVEHDYNSKTFAGSWTYLMARKNTTAQLGFVRGWDEVYPQIREGRKERDVITLSFGLTQLLTPKALMQINLSYSKQNGFLSDAYQVVQIIDFDGSDFTNFEPVHPDVRIRKAAGWRVNYKTGKMSALHVGLRYYWDSWNVHSFTTSVAYRHHLGKAGTIGFSVRNYVQNKAFFFKARYFEPEAFMTVDPKLDALFSNDYQLKLTLNGGHYAFLPSAKTQLDARIDFYHRRTETPHWHSRAKNLFAYIVSLGVRYHFHQ